MPSLHHVKLIALAFLGILAILELMKFEMR